MSIVGDEEKQFYCDVGTCRCFTMLTTSRVEYGYWSWPSSARWRNSPKALTRRMRVASGTSGPYWRSMASSASMLGLSMAWQLKRSPREAKKSLPKNGKPGRLAWRRCYQTFLSRTRLQSLSVSTHCSLKLVSKAGANQKSTLPCHTESPGPQKLDEAKKAI